MTKFEIPSTLNATYEPDPDDWESGYVRGTVTLYWGDFPIREWRTTYIDNDDLDQFIAGKISEMLGVNSGPE